MGRPGGHISELAPDELGLGVEEEPITPLSDCIQLCPINQSARLIQRGGQLRQDDVAEDVNDWNATDSFRAQRIEELGQCDSRHDLPP